MPAGDARSFTSSKETLVPEVSSPLNQTDTKWLTEGVSSESLNSLIWVAAATVTNLMLQKYWNKSNQADLAMKITEYLDRLKKNCTCLMMISIIMEIKHLKLQILNVEVF